MEDKRVDSTSTQFVNLFLVNSEGKLWIPRRTATKKLFPLCLDMSMGGHVEAGEDYDTAFKRELLEELNIDADTVPWRVLGDLTPLDGVAANMRVYEMKTDTTPDFNPEDFMEYTWLSPQELLDKLSRGEKTKSDLPVLVRQFYM